MSEYIPPSGDLNSTSQTIYLKTGPASVPAITQDEWDLFFTDYVQITAEQFEGHSEYYTDLIKKYQALHTINPPTPGITWGDFLKQSDLWIRMNSPFLWAYRIMTGLLPQLQEVTVAESDRVLFLTNAEKVATSHLAAVTFQIPSSGTGACNIVKQNQNTLYQADMQTYLGWQQIVSARSSTTSNNISQLQSGISADSSLMSSLLQQLSSTMQQLFS